MKCKRTSQDDDVPVIFKMDRKKCKFGESNIYVAFVFDDTWQLGYITSTCDQELEASINPLKSCNNG